MVQNGGIMNTIEDLINHGIEQHTAKKMLEDYKKRIGTMNGVYKIIDINYDFNERGRDIILQCSGCGKTIHRMMIKGRNKWSELIKTCKDCEERKRKDNLEKSEKLKKEEILSHIGKTYGDYLIVDVKFGMPDKLIGKCQACGYEKEISYPSVKNGHWKDNKCHKHYAQPIKYDKSYIGKRYGRLTVIDVKDKCVRKFKCRCDCGNIYYAVPCDLENGSVKSCGCIKDEISANAISYDRLYKVWQDMKRRCYSESDVSYKNYGARGIAVCDEWRYSYENFKKWAYANGYDENAPYGECTIDRIDVNGNYEPSNCRWTDMKTQNNNKRPREQWDNEGYRSFIVVNGERISKRKACEQCGVSVQAFDYRINKMGMTPEKALALSGRKGDKESSVSLRVNVRQYNFLQDKSKETGLPISELLREMIIEEMIKR